MPQRPKSPSLSDIIDTDEIAKSGVFEDPEVLNRLKAFLPEENNSTPQTFQDNVRSSQFKQAMRVFTQALKQSQDMAGVLLSLGLDPNLAGPNTTIEEFLLALEKRIKEKQQEHQSQMDTSS